eukprot:COSAG01_NODE_2230_length_8125_cov_9.414652_1_plen_75_part_00
MLYPLEDERGAWRAHRLVLCTAEVFVGRDSGWAAHGPRAHGAAGCCMLLLLLLPAPPTRACVRQPILLAGTYYR